jgi:hypothetical protein
MGTKGLMIEQINKPISCLTLEELSGEKAKLPEYRTWYEAEGKRYFKSLGNVFFEPELPENELLNFKYLQAVYSLNRFYGGDMSPSAYLETKNEKICAEVIKAGGTIVDMYKAGADAVYCALLSDPVTDKDILLKTVDMHIPF